MLRLLRSNTFLRHHLPFRRLVSVTSSCDSSKGTSTLTLEPKSYESCVPKELPSDFQYLSLASSWNTCKDHKILRFHLPPGISSLKALGAPSGVKVKETVGGIVLNKSYSPVSHPNEKGIVDILVKTYPYQKGGGLGKHLYDMEATKKERIQIKLKPKKLFHGEIYSPNRWSSLLLIGNGTGVCPLYQLALAISSDPNDCTKVYFFCQYRHPNENVLTQKMLNKLNNEQVFIKTFYSNDNEYVNLNDIERLEYEDENKHCLVCGTDGFLESICGKHVRVDIGKSKLKKQQGPLKGYLMESGDWIKEEVTKL